jgi:hypothetical protein
MNEITISDLEQFADGKESLQIILELPTISKVNNPYAKFTELIERAIDHISQEIARNPELKQNLSEDQITHEVVMLLRNMGFDATHETKVGGHCDITIEARQQMLWLGEAKKIHNQNNHWLYKGFMQLSSRYSTGNNYQNTGGIIIYCFASRIDKIMKNWENYLKNNFIDDIDINWCHKVHSVFYSEHIHERTGQKFRVRHVPISLYFLPRE